MTRGFLVYENVSLHGRDTHATNKVGDFSKRRNKKSEQVALLTEKDSILAVSGSLLHQQKCTEIGMDGFLGKPSFPQLVSGNPLVRVRVLRG